MPLLDPKEEVIVRAYVANGSNNCVAVVRLGGRACATPKRTEKDTSAVVGLIPTGWYPGAVRLSPAADTRTGHGTRCGTSDGGAGL